jgi:hypothetical protein
MSGERTERRPDDGPGEEDQQRRLQREREKAGADQQDAASGPGYTARPSEEEPEEGSKGTRGDG